MGLMDALKRTKRGGKAGTGRQALVSIPGQQPVKVRFEGGSGESPAAAIVIKGATSAGVGAAAEYKYLGHLLGERGRDWNLEGETIVHFEGRPLDVMEIALSDGGRRSIFFDISDFFDRP